MSKKFGQCGTKADVKVKLLQITYSLDHPFDSSWNWSDFSVEKISFPKTVSNVWKMKSKLETESLFTPIKALLSVK